MSKSRKNPGREKNLQNYKKKIQVEKQIKNKINTIMSERTQQNQMGLAEVRQSPVWNSNEMLEISGGEWESIFNFIESSSAAFMAANAVMSRNIINGKVKLKFEKLNKETFMYEDMTAEEEAPYQAEFQKAVQNAILAQQANVSESVEDFNTPYEPPSQEGLPRLDALVDQNGNQISTDNKSNLIVV